MSQSLYANSADDSTPPRARFWKRILASKIILLSIAIHILFGLGATYLIIQSIQARRKLTFQGGPGTPNASTQALEHQINMTRRQQTMSAPAQAKRITTTGLAKISPPLMTSPPIRWPAWVESAWGSEWEGAVVAAVATAEVSRFSACTMPARVSRGPFTI
jgi:hypothetical protein